MAVPPLSYLFSGNVSKEKAFFPCQEYLIQKLFIATKVDTIRYTKVTGMVLIIRMMFGMSKN